MFKTVRKLLKFRRWIKSRTLNVAGVAMILASVDAAMLRGDLGMFFLSGFMTAINWIPGVALSTEQGISIIVIVAGAVASLLRAVTDKPIEARENDNATWRAK